MLVDAHAVRPASSRQLYLHAHARNRAVWRKRKTPYRVGARGGDKQRVFLRVEDQPVRARHAVGQFVQRAVRRIAVHASARVGQIALALVSEIQVAVGCEREVVDAFEVLAMVARDDRRDFAAGGVEQHDAEFVIGHEDAAVLVDAQAIGFAGIFSDDVKFALRRDAKDAAVRNVNDIEIARAVERRAFEKAARGNAAAAGSDALGRHVALAQRLRQGDEYFGFDHLRRREHGVVTS